MRQAFVSVIAPFAITIGLGLILHPPGKSDATTIGADIRPDYSHKPNRGFLAPGALCWVDADTEADGLGDEEGNGTLGNDVPGASIAR